MHVLAQAGELGIGELCEFGQNLLGTHRSRVAFCLLTLGGGAICDRLCFLIATLDTVDKATAGAVQVALSTRIMALGLECTPAVGKADVGTSNGASTVAVVVSLATVLALEALEALTGSIVAYAVLVAIVVAQLLVAEWASPTVVTEACSIVAMAIPRALLVEHANRAILPVTQGAIPALLTLASVYLAITMFTIKAGGCNGGVGLVTRSMHTFRADLGGALRACPAWEAIASGPSANAIAIALVMASLA